MNKGDAFDVEQPFPVLSFSANLSPVESDLAVSEEGDFGPFIANDVGAIESRDIPPIIICVMMAGHRGNWENLEDTVARIAEKVWEYGIYSSR